MAISSAGLAGRAVMDRAEISLEDFPRHRIFSQILFIEGHVAKLCFGTQLSLAMLPFSL
jgi:hypothetical protein